MPTFKFVGPEDGLRIKGVELKKGEPFTTNNTLLASALAEMPNVREVVQEQEEKPSRRSSVRS